MNDALVMDLLEKVKSRFYGKYRGVVVDVDAATMRVKASVPSVLPLASTGWATACVPYAGPQVGFIMLPEVGSGVWIEFEAGDVSFPIWTGCYWRTDEVPSDASATVKTIVTKAGSLAFDDDAGSITMKDGNGDSVSLNGGAVTIESANGKIVADSSGVSVNDGGLTVT
ncbi:MAG TPA: phage baseplate assembly protein V [Caulobacteraceae bacterium]|jgi:uncharacterized protein involved in type VI secretion and phage assembly